MELCPCKDNGGQVINNNNRVQRNGNQTYNGNFSREKRNNNYNRRPPFENNNRSAGQGAMRDFHFQCQENVKPARWDAQFQAHGIDGRGVVEAL